MWSSPIEVMAVTSGVMTLVQSSRPPSPTSTTASSTACAANVAKASAVHTSKNVRSRPSGRAPIPPRHCASAASSAQRPLTRMRSRKSTRWGEVKSPVRSPAARSARSIRAQTEPLPLVPATWTERKARCGSPIASSNAVMPIRSCLSRRRSRP